MSDSQSVAYREAQLGRTFDIDNHYYDWTDNFPGKLETDDVAAGRVPEITWWGTSYASILDGSYDDMIRARAEAVKAFGHPMFIRWAAEMNGYWFAWGGAQNGDDSAAFVAAWRHIHDIFASVGATNVSWVWAPNSESNPGGDDLTFWNNWRNYYPGDNYVDWVGIDGYNWGNHFNGVDEWQALGSIMGAIYNDYASKKPIMIAETASTESGGSKSSWIDSARAWIKDHPAVKALVWFDHSYVGGMDWAIDSSQASLDAFKSLAQDPYFAPSVGGTSTSSTPSDTASTTVMPATSTTAAQPTTTSTTAAQPTKSPKRPRKSGKHTRRRHSRNVRLRRKASAQCRAKRTNGNRTKRVGKHHRLHPAKGRARRRSCARQRHG